MRQTEEQKQEEQRILAHRKAKYPPVNMEFRPSGTEGYLTWHLASKDILLRDSIPVANYYSSTSSYQNLSSGVDRITTQVARDWAEVLVPLKYGTESSVDPVGRCFPGFPKDGSVTQKAAKKVRPSGSVCCCLTGAFPFCCLFHYADNFIHFTYQLGPSDCSWLESRDKNILNTLLERQAEQRTLDPIDERAIRTLTYAYPEEALAARAKNEPTRIRHLALKQEREAKARRDAEIQRKQEAEAEVTRRREEAEARRLQLNRSLHALFETNPVTTRRLQELLGQGAEINYQAEKDSYTVLMLAVDSQNAQIIEWLLNNGANPLIENKHGEKASNIANKRSSIYQALKNYELLFAARSGNLEAAKLAHRTGAMINFQNPADGYTALMVAIKQGHRELAAFLLSSRADPALTGYDGMDAHELARTCEMSDLVNSPVLPRETQPSLSCPYTLFPSDPPHPTSGEPTRQHSRNFT